MSGVIRTESEERLAHPTTFKEKVKYVFLYEPQPGEKVPAALFFKHRYVRFVSYMIVCLCMTLVYYSWQPLSLMLFKEGAYAWKCENGVTSRPEDPFNCIEQKTAVGSLYTIGLSSEFGLGVLAGLSLDKLGPLVTGAIGQAMFVIGWLMMAYSSEAVQLYIPAIVFLAGAVNMIAFPALILGDFFPSKSGLAISLVVAAQTAGTMVAPILKAIADANPSLSFKEIIWGYLGFIVLPCIALYMITLPFKRRNQSEAPRAEKSLVALEGVTASAADNLGVQEAPVQIAISTKAVKELGFLKLLVTPEYIIFTLYYVIQLLQFGYFPLTTVAEYGEDVAEFQGNILPTQAIFGALFGILVDYTKTPFICVVLISMMALTFIFALIPSIGLGYAAQVLYVLSNSYIYTVKYTYAAEIFPPTHFGVLIGLIGCIAGVMNLINIPVEKADQYVPTIVGYLSAEVLCYFIMAYLWYRQCKGIHYKLEEPQLLKEAQLNDPRLVDASDAEFARKATREMPAAMES